MRTQKNKSCVLRRWQVFLFRTTRSRLCDALNLIPNNHNDHQNNVAWTMTICSPDMSRCFKYNPLQNAGKSREYGTTGRCPASHPFQLEHYTDRLYAYLPASLHEPAFVQDTCCSLQSNLQHAPQHRYMLKLSKGFPPNIGPSPGTAATAGVASHSPSNGLLPAPSVGRLPPRNSPPPLSSPLPWALAVGCRCCMVVFLGLGGSGGPCWTWSRCCCCILVFFGLGGTGGPIWT